METEIYLLKTDLDSSYRRQMGSLRTRPVNIKAIMCLSWSRPAAFWSEVCFPGPPQVQGESVIIPIVCAAHGVPDTPAFFSTTPPATDALLRPLSRWVTVGNVGETGNARHSRVALYPMGDNGRRAERQGCARGRVPHQHTAPPSGQEAAFPVTPPSSSTPCDSALAFLLPTHASKARKRVRASLSRVTGGSRRLPDHKFGLDSSDYGR